MAREWVCNDRQIVHWISNLPASDAQLLLFPPCIFSRFRNVFLIRKNDTSFHAKFKADQSDCGLPFWYSFVHYDMQHAQYLHFQTISSPLLLYAVMQQPLVTHFILRNKIRRCFTLYVVEYLVTSECVKLRNLNDSWTAHHLSLNMYKHCPTALRQSNNFNILSMHEQLP